MEEPADVEALELQVVQLVEEIERYRTAAEDALSQVDWCIGYFTAKKQAAIARALNANRSYIRSALMGLSEQPLPTTTAHESPEDGPGGNRIPKQGGGQG